MTIDNDDNDGNDDHDADDGNDTDAVMTMMTDNFSFIVVAAFAAQLQYKSVAP